MCYNIVTTFDKDRKSIMSKARKDYNDLKENLTIRIPRWQIDKLRKIKNYNRIIEELLEEYFKNNK